MRRIPPFALVSGAYSGFTNSSEWTEVGDVCWKISCAFGLGLLAEEDDFPEPLRELNAFQVRDLRLKLGALAWCFIEDPPESGGGGRSTMSRLRTLMISTTSTESFGSELGI